MWSSDLKATEEWISLCANKNALVPINILQCTLSFSIQCCMLPSTHYTQMHLLCVYSASHKTNSVYFHMRVKSLYSLYYRKWTSVKGVHTCIHTYLYTIVFEWKYMDQNRIFHVVFQNPLHSLLSAWPQINYWNLFKWFKYSVKCIKLTMR